MKGLYLSWLEGNIYRILYSYGSLEPFGPLTSNTHTHTSAHTYTHTHRNTHRHTHKTQALYSLHLHIHTSMTYTVSSLFLHEIQSLLEWLFWSCCPMYLCTQASTLIAELWQE